MTRLIPFDQMPLHQDSEDLVETMMSKSRNSDPMFFRNMVAYYWGVVAAMMRASVVTPEGDSIPINVFAINLSPSGTGKGISSSMMEQKVLRRFFDAFQTETLPLLEETELPKLALKRASVSGGDPDQELEAVNREYKSQGAYVPVFDSGTSAAVKQARHKLLMVGAGALNFQMDEVGSNIGSNDELLNLFLDFYDLGLTKQKLVKNTSDNVRTQEINGSVPANLLLFGAPERLLDGGKNEESFDAFLETGYGRRCLFGYTPQHARIENQMTPEQLYAIKTSKKATTGHESTANRIENLANIINMNKKIVMSEDVALAWLEYQLVCEKRAGDLAEHESMRRTEMMHRHFKTLKIAGAFAFIDDSPEITQDHLFMSIRLVEESGKAFYAMLNREKPHVKLARYIASVGHEVTQADLVDALPFYKGTNSQKAEMMTLSISYGYKHNIIIKKSFEDGIEFLRGESLEETDTQKLILAHSADIAYGYQNEEAPFDQLHKLTQLPNHHWTTHHFTDAHRQDDSAIPGFNMVVLDIDGTVPLSVAKDLLKDYKALYYTTKSHTEASNRFRIVMPINYVLKLDRDEFKEFMKGVFEWLPFDVDDVTGQRARKWASHNGTYEYTDGQLLDVLPFIPKTSKNEQRRELLKDQSQMDNLERWVINNTGDGNRNNQLMRYAFLLVDAGYPEEVIRSRTIDLNDKLADKLSEAEITGTIMVSVAKRVVKRDSQP